jgi:thioredoxin reductase (NADPH)
MSDSKDMAMNKSADILIVGGGPAGYTAGIYAARAGRKTIILEGRGASRLAVGYNIENYPGFPEISSLELLQKFRAQAIQFGAEVSSEEAIDFNLSAETKYVVTRERLYEARAFILATGKPVTRERLIPGEDRLLGQGVSYCATCDGPFYRGLPAAALGASDEAAEEILALQGLGCRVLWIPGEAQAGRVSEQLLAQIRAKNIPVRWKSSVKEIVGQKGVEKIILDTEGAQEELPVSAVFVFRESLTSPLLLKAGLRLDHRQCLAVDRLQRTNLEGVYAAGDLTCGGMQVVTAAGEGAVAAMQAVSFLRKKA